MSNQEQLLREQLKSEDNEIAVKAAVDLCTEILHPQSRWEDSEFVLLGVVGLQNLSSGQIIQLLLGQTYIKMNEIPRAIRFFERASESSIADIKSQAENSLSELRNR